MICILEDEGAIKEYITSCPPVAIYIPEKNRNYSFCRESKLTIIQIPTNKIFVKTNHYMTMFGETYIAYIRF